MLLTKHYTILLFSLSFVLPASATSIVVIAGNQGIVVASDSKSVKKVANKDRRDTVGEDMGLKKFVIIQNRVVVASFGHDQFGPRYDFLTWIGQVEDQIPINASVEDVARIVVTESAHKFSTFDSLFQRGVIQQADKMSDCEDFVHYVIAGYQGGMPRLYEVHFYIDWDRKMLIGPKQSLIEPSPKNSGTFRLYFFGIKEGITNVMERQSYAYKKTMATSPSAFGNLVKHGEVTLNESTAIARSLIEVEEDVSPNFVGGRVRIAQINPDGRALDLADVLPKAKSGAAKKK